MTDSFFIAYCLLFIALFVWACVADTERVKSAQRRIKHFILDFLSIRSR